MKMRTRLIQLLAALSILFVASCSKELSRETPTNSGKPTGDFRAKIDGVDWVAADDSKSATILSGVINVTGTSADGKSISITILGDATGSYTVDANSTGIAEYDDSDGSFSTNQSTDPAKAGGTVVITEIDEANKTISGTFVFNGYDPNTGTTKVITEGIFQKLPYSTTLPPASITDTLTAKIDGVDFKATSIAAPIISGNLFVQGAASDGTHFVGIYMPQGVQPGSYTLDFYGATYIGQYSPDAGTVLVSQGNGTLTIIENNSTTRRIKGTFNFTASDISNTKTAQITEGYFSVGY